MGLDRQGHMQERVRSFTDIWNAGTLPSLRWGGVAPWLVSIAFIPSYVMLDWASYVYPFGPFFITPWNPQPGLAVLLVMALGLPHAASVFAAVLLADVIVRDAPGGFALAITGSLLLAVGYAAMGVALRTRLSDPGLRSLRDLGRFCVMVAGITAIVALAFVGTLFLWGQPVGMSWPRAWLRFWIGDLVGIYVTVPLLLVAADPGRRATLARMARSLEAWAVCLLVLGMLALIFLLHREDAARLFYLLFIPLVLLSLRWGMPGAVVAAALAQGGVLAGMQQAATVLPIFELQSLVAAFTMTGLFLGVAADERRESEARLRESLRLAAAGEMAGAIAHEVNQPLTAAGVFAESAGMLLARGASREQLGEVLDKMIAEIRRSADVMHRLRELFSSGTTTLEPVEVEALLESVRRMAARIVGDAPIRVDIPPAPALPALYIDRVQVELVFRNLLANSAQSLVLARRQGTISVAAEPAAEPGWVRFRVRDDGPGIAASTRTRLFQPFASGKSMGMGIGLAVSRSIAEAHGGKLEAVSHQPAEFHLTLPCMPKT